MSLISCFLLFFSTHFDIWALCDKAAALHTATLTVAVCWKEYCLLLLLVTFLSLSLVIYMYVVLIQWQKILVQDFASAINAHPEGHTLPCLSVLVTSLSLSSTFCRSRLTCCGAAVKAQFPALSLLSCITGVFPQPTNSCKEMMKHFITATANPMSHRQHFLVGLHCFMLYTLRAWRQFTASIIKNINSADNMSFVTLSLQKSGEQSVLQWPGSIHCRESSFTKYFANRSSCLALFPPLLTMMKIFHRIISQAVMCICAKSLKSLRKVKVIPKYFHILSAGMDVQKIYWQQSGEVCLMIVTVCSSHSWKIHM